MSRPAPTAERLVADYRAGRREPVAAIADALDAADAARHRFAAVSAVNRADATRAAAESAARWAAGEPRGPLDGVPVTVKDSFHVLGLPRWHGSAVHEGARSTWESTPIRRLREAGAVLVAKTTMPDFAMLSSGVSSAFGIVRNPWDPATNPGGSSSGAAAGLAAGIAPLALGTDMAGSVRTPAALVGAAALCPTQGRIAYEPSATYRSAGPMAFSVADLEAALTVLGRHDPADRYALPGAFAAAPPRDRLDGIRIGVVAAANHGPAPDDATATALTGAVALLEARGAKIVGLGPLPVDRSDHDALLAFMRHRGLVELFGGAPERRGRLHPAVAALLDPALQDSGLALSAAMEHLTAAAQRVGATLGTVDYVLSPTVPARAYPAEAITSDDAVGVLAPVVFTCWYNLAGVPAGSIPVARPDAGPPVSVQVAGARFDDAGVLDVMRMLEADRGFELVLPEPTA